MIDCLKKSKFYCFHNASKWRLLVPPLWTVPHCHKRMQWLNCSCLRMRDQNLSPNQGRKKCCFILQYFIIKQCFVGFSASFETAWTIAGGAAQAKWVLSCRKVYIVIYMWNSPAIRQCRVFGTACGKKKKLYFSLVAIPFLCMCFHNARCTLLKCFEYVLYKRTKIELSSFLEFQYF